MTGWQLKLWRKGLNWSRERAAAQLGVSLRTYKNYENSDNIRPAIALATVTLTLANMLPALKSRNVSKGHLLELLQRMTTDVTGK